MSGNSGENRGGHNPGNEAPDIDLYPVVINFGEVASGVRAAQSLQIRNWGRGVLVLSTVALRGDNRSLFELGSWPSGEVTVPPGEARGVQVSFAPRGEGTFQDAIVIVSNDPDEARIEVPLTGRLLVSQAAGDHRIYIEAGETEVRTRLNPGDNWSNRWVDGKFAAAQDKEIHVRLSKVGYREVVTDGHEKVKPHDISLTLDWGDGTKPDPVTLDKGAVAASHTWKTPGVYFLRLIATETAPHAGVKDDEVVGLAQVESKDDKTKWFDAYVDPRNVATVVGDSRRLGTGAGKKTLQVRVGYMGNVRVKVAVAVTLTLTNKETKAETSLTGNGSVIFEAGDGSSSKLVNVTVEYGKDLAGFATSKVEVEITPTNEEGVADANPGNNKSSAP